jgi:hypothetical protein
MLDQEILQIIACPKCKGRLEYHSGTLEGREPEPKLICHNCRLQYEVKDDIPILLIDEAKPL